LPFGGLHLNIESFEWLRPVQRLVYDAVSRTDGTALVDAAYDLVTGSADSVSFREAEQVLTFLVPSRENVVVIDHESRVSGAVDQCS
jgi:hypothetical protein